MIRRKRLKINSKLLFVMGMMFISAGMFASYMSFGKMSYNYLQSQSWQPVAATIHNLELKTSYGDDNTTFSLEAKYSYVVDGREYTNTQVALSDGYDNIGSFWHDLKRELERKRSRNKVYAWVDLSHPENAVLDRSFRWRMLIFGSLFIIMFGMVGGGILWASFLPEKSKVEVINEAKSGIISDEANSYKFIFWFGMLFFLVGAGFTALVLPDAIQKGEYLALFVVVFAIVGACIIAYAWRQKSLYMATGKTILFLDPIPGAIGGQVGGYFDVAARSDDTPLTMRLSCIETRKSGDDTYTSILWQEETMPYTKNKVDGMRVIFTFDVPVKLPHSHEKKNNISIEWKLSCEGEFDHYGKPLEFARSWGIPMENSSRQSRAMDYVPARFTETRAALVEGAAQKSAEEQIPIADIGGNLSITSRAGRGLSLKLPFALVGSLFATIGFFTRNDWLGGYFFMIFGGLFAVLSTFMIGRKINVVINTVDQMIFMGRSWLNLPLYTKRIHYSEPSQFSIKKTSSSTSREKLIEFFDLYVESNGKKVKIAEDVEGEKTAEALLESVRDRLFNATE